jgi:hypothetical protein
MVDRINEPDWKLFRTLHPVAFGRFCERVLAEIAQINADVRKSHHERYLEIWEVLKSRDREVAATFDDKRRSTALMQLAMIRFSGLLTDAEFSRFSEETRSIIERFQAYRQDEQ